MVAVKLDIRILFSLLVKHVHELIHSTNRAFKGTDNPAMVSRGSFSNQEKSAIRLDEFGPHLRELAGTEPGKGPGHVRVMISVICMVGHILLLEVGKKPVV